MEEIFLTWTEEEQNSFRIQETDIFGVIPRPRPFLLSP